MFETFWHTVVVVVDIERTVTGPDTPSSSSLLSHTLRQLHSFTTLINIIIAEYHRIIPANP